MNGNINLNSNEKNLLTEVLYNERRDLAKKHQDTKPIDNLIDKTLGRVTLYHKDEKVVSLSNGVSDEYITIGSIFESDHGRFIVQDIDGRKIKINGNWYHKSEFEPATVTKFKGKHRGAER